MASEAEANWQSRAERAENITTIQQNQIERMIYARDAEKQRAEKAEAALAAKAFSHDEWEREATAIAKHLGFNVSEPQDGWEQQCIEAIDDLRSRKDKAEAACAEMRAVLEASRLEHLGHRCSNEWFIERDRALSSDCGKGYFHKSELTPLVKALRYAASVRTDRASVEDGVCMCSQTADWCSGLIDALDEAAPIVERLESLRKDAK